MNSSVDRPTPSSPETERRMKSQRREDTDVELRIRRKLHALGYRYRIHYRILNSRRKVDIAFTRKKIAVFTDGCFWHVCPKHGSLPKANQDWWREKLRTNVRRDQETDQLLRASGWTVVRVWEHEETMAAVERIRRAVERA